MRVLGACSTNPGCAITTLLNDNQAPKNKSMFVPSKCADMFRCSFGANGQQASGGDDRGAKYSKVVQMSGMNRQQKPLARCETHQGQLSPVHLDIYVS
jgi:hypothetical protein